MNATTKKTTLTTEQIELNNEKKELAKLTKIIEKTPSKKELKEVTKIEAMEEIKTINLLSENINYTFEEYLNNKNLIKQLQQKNNILISDIFKEITSLMINFKSELETNMTNYKHIEFNKKSLIIILRNKLENKLNKELFNIYATVLDYMSFNLTIQLNLVSLDRLFLSFFKVSFVSVLVIAFMILSLFLFNFYWYGLNYNFLQKTYLKSTVRIIFLYSTVTILSAEK